MRYPGAITEGLLVRRANRFIAEVRIEDGLVVAHVPNTGRLEELLFPGNRVLLMASGSASRKTAWTLLGAAAAGTWACLVSAWANPLTREAAALGLIPVLAGYDTWRPEVKWGESRLDFRLSIGATVAASTSAAAPDCLVEVKGVTLVEDAGLARFPDAPTARGARHLGELVRAVQQGHRAAVVFMVKRPDAIAFAPNDRTDPAFATALRQAKASGVDVAAVLCAVSEREITPVRSLPVKL